MSEKFSRYDTANYLHSEEDIVLYLDACLEEDPGDGSLIRTASGVISRARGMSRLARETVTISRHFAEAMKDADCSGQDILTALKDEREMLFEDIYGKQPEK